jgi:hypothetical protein
LHHLQTHLGLDVVLRLHDETRPLQDYFLWSHICGTALAPPRSRWDKDHDTEDSISHITLENGGKLTGSAVRPDWFGKHGSGKDLMVWLNGDNDDSNNEALEALMRLIPASRNDEYDRLPWPYKIDIIGLDIDAVKWVPAFVSRARRSMYGLD